MPYQRPTLADITNRTQKDLDVSVGQTSPVLSRSIFSVLSRVFAGAIHSVFGFGAYMAKQLFPDTAEDEFLERWAAIWGLTRKAADFSSGPAIFTGVDGSEIIAGTRAVGANGVEYEVVTGGTIASGSVTLTVEALTSGFLGNLAAGSLLSMVEPLPGVDTEVTVAAAGITGGSDVESDEDLQARIVARITNPPHGGNESDYRAWALDVAGVTRAWAYQNYMGPGTVGLTFVTDDDPGGIIPAEGKVDEVFNYIESVRPLCVDLYVFAPIEQVVNFTIQVTPNTPEVKAAVEAELRAMFLDRFYPGDTVSVSQISEFVSGAAGEVAHSITVPASDTVIAQNKIGVFGVITWL